MWLHKHPPQADAVVLKKNVISCGPSFLLGLRRHAHSKFSIAIRLFKGLGALLRSLGSSGASALCVPKIAFQPVVINSFF